MALRLSEGLGVTRATHEKEQSSLSRVGLDDLDREVPYAPEDEDVPKYVKSQLNRPVAVVELSDERLVERVGLRQGARKFCYCRVQCLVGLVQGSKADDDEADIERAYDYSL